MKGLIIMLSLIIALLIGCSKKNDDNPKMMNTQTKNEMTTYVHQGEVINKLDTGNYSYLQIKENDNTYWIAVPTMDVKKGEMVFFSQYMEMEDFKSGTLNRTFKSVLFVSDAKKSQTGMDIKNIHPNLNSQKNVDVKIDRVADGKSIAQIYQEKNQLKGKSVKVKGKVVKYNPGIMGRNWIHIQDGTGDEKGFDLLVTSDDQTKVGNVIVAEGTLALDKDFGAGYTYKVLIENAKIKEEKQL